MNTQAKPTPQRQRFEAWARSTPGAESDEVKRDAIGNYKYNEVAHGWRAWQACEKSLSSYLLSRMEELERDYGFTEVIDLGNFDQHAMGPQWNRAYGQWETYLWLKGILEEK